MPKSKIGVLLVNLGTPAAPKVKDIRDFLHQLLGDPQVLDMPGVLRWLLLHFIILPFRPKRLVEPYKSIWTKEGSPFLVNVNNLKTALQKELGDTYKVIAGMQCGEPSIESALKAFRKEGIYRVSALPMYPQYAQSTTGSGIRTMKRLARRYGGGDWTFQLQVLPPFYDREGYIGSLLNLISENSPPTVNRSKPAAKPFYLFSYHGLPVRHIKKISPNCMHSAFRCCENISEANRNCYRAQCRHTTRALTSALGLEPEQYAMSFQSRLGRAEWLQPSTADMVARLPKRGIKHLVVVTPSFTVDCLETLEEIGIQAKTLFLKAGGQSFRLLPCLNASSFWVGTIAKWFRNSVL